MFLIFFVIRNNFPIFYNFVFDSFRKQARMGLSIEKIRQGDELAFKELFDEYYQALCVFATTYLKDDT